MQLNIIKAIIYDKFGADRIPYWLVFGVAAEKSDYSCSEPLTHIPSLRELEIDNSKEFKSVCGFQAASLFVKHIQQNYGWEMIIKFLLDYDFYKEDLYKSWIDSLSYTYNK